MLLNQHPVMEPTPTLYDAIGVSVDASADKIKRKVRKLVEEVRGSDKRNTEKNELIRFFKSARDTLANPDARKEYDQSIGIETVSNNDTAADDAESIVSFQPFQPFGALGALGSIGSLLSPIESSRSRTPSTSLMGLLGADISDMFSNSIIPEEMSSSTGSLKPGSFQVLEYTKVRNSDGGFDEFGFTRQGDMRNDRVTEKRFERKS
jgi:curved DNA-binding protein CbpA